MKKWLLRSLLVMGLAVPGMASAEIYALIMTISDYQGGIPKLKGVMRDVENARSIAHLLGVRDENILQYRDAQLDYAGMEHAFDDLDRRVRPGDKVFIYYSGHGGRQRVHDPEERCAESLVSVDGYGLIDAEMDARLKKLSKRAQKIIAMFDACHSGGVSTRAINSNAKFTPKFWSKDGPNTCERPVNVVTRGIKLATQSAGSGGRNYVYIAAARDNEVSLDQAGKGGMATTAWLDCMSGAKDMDGSGGLTVEEIQICAQQKIDEEMKGAQGFLPQHIKVIGNPDLVMTLAQEKTAAVSESEGQATQAPLPSDEQMPSVNETETVAQPVAQSGAVATLADIFNGRDDRRTVTITPIKDRLKIGRDKFGFGIRSSSPGYLYLLMVGTDGKTFDILFPNKLDGNNYIQAGQTIQFPRPGWEIVAQGPAGTDHLLAIVADAPRDFSKLPVTNAGPFSMVSTSHAGTRGIQLITSTPQPEMQSQCGNVHTRTLAVVQACSDAYGAAMVEVTEAMR